MISPSKPRAHIHYAWLIVLSGCAFMGTTLGALGYTVGNFFLPVSRELGCGVGDVSLYVTINSISIALFIILTRRFVERHMRAALTTGALLIVIALVGLSCSTALWQFYLWAICLGAGSGFYNGATVPTLINSWFRTRNGMALGICLASAALIGAVMNPLIAAIIERFSWQTGYRFLALTAALLLLPFTVFVVRPSPQSLSLRPYGEAHAVVAPAAAEAPVSGATLGQAVRSPAFYLLLFVAPGFSMIFGLTSHLPAYADSIGLGTSIGAALTSASLIGGMLGKLTLGMLGDRFGARTPLAVSQLAVISGTLLIALGPVSSLLLVPGALIFGYGACTTALMPAMLTSAVFGQRDYNRILTWFTMSSSLVGGFGSTIYGFLYDGSGNYASSIALCLGVSCCCLLFGLLALARGRRQFSL